MVCFALSLGHPTQCHHLLIHRCEGHLCEFVVMIMPLPILFQCAHEHIHEWIIYHHLTFFTTVGSKINIAELWKIRL
jgi:hypothetical protein